MTSTAIDRKLTCKRDRIDHRDWILQLSPSPQLQATTSVDLRAQCPAIVDQGNLGSCVSNGVGFNIQYIQTKNAMLHQFMSSRLYIYYNTRVIEQTVNEDSGTTIRDALTAVTKQGTCPETLWPYNISQFAVKPSSQSYLSGAMHTVKSYLRVQLDLTQMKQCLANGYPFVFGILLYQSFYSVGSDGLVAVPKGGEFLLGGHCMACVGYNDTTQRFIVRNSWGTTWGDQGYCYIPYSYMTDANNVFDLWTIQTMNDTETVYDLTKIKNVSYGKGKKYRDVTAVFKAYFTKGNTQLSVENSLFGDPSPGIVKELRITFINNSVKVYAEHKVIKQADLVSTTVNEAVFDLTKITNVVYGKGTKYADVTTILKTHFASKTQLAVENSVFGDPNPGVVKELKVTFTNNSIKTFVEHRVINQNDLIPTTLRALRLGTFNVFKLDVLTEAKYGVGDQWIDVTNIVKNHFSLGRPVLVVSTQHLIECWPDLVKELQITLSDGTVKTFKEGESLGLADIA
jgi:hypothetical protein